MIVMEYLAGGELFDKIAADDELLESDCCSYIRQICQVGNYCGSIRGLVRINHLSSRIQIAGFGVPSRP